MALLSVKALAVILGMAAAGNHSFAQTPTPAEAPVVSETSLPGGAMAVQETFDDWQVICEVLDGARACGMVQRQWHRESGQMVLSAELTDITDKGLRGQLVLPFGLKLARGVTIGIDENAASPPIPFETCLPAGCVVPILFDDTVLSALRAGTTLKLGAVASADGQEVALPISLKGFAAAEARLRELTQP